MGLRNASPAANLLLLNGTPVRLGVLVATTTVNNHTTATAFNNTGDALKGMMLMVQPDAACHISAGTANTATATTTGVKLEANEKFIISMGEDFGWLACVAVSGTVNLQVYELR